MGILNNPAVQSVGIEECGEPLVRLDNEEFVVDSMYFNWGYNSSNFIRLRSGLVERLRKAKDALPDGWNFKIWDGYRTLKTQKILYENYWDELVAKNPRWLEDQLHKAVQIFVSPPSRDRRLPAPHNTGGAVDLTIVDKEGCDVPMGTNFDEFDVKSYTDHFKKGQFFENRSMLCRVLGDAGLVNYHEEWWHFSYGDQEWAMQTGTDTAIYGSMEL